MRQKHHSHRHNDDIPQNFIRQLFFARAGKPPYKRKRDYVHAVPGRAYYIEYAAHYAVCRYVYMAGKISVGQSAAELENQALHALVNAYMHYLFYV